jgi:Ca2+-binding RTX toxin-like protein
MAEQFGGALTRRQTFATRRARLVLAVTTAIGLILTSFVGIAATSAADDESASTTAEFIAPLSDVAEGGAGDGDEVAVFQTVALDLALLDGSATRLTMSPFGRAITVQRTNIETLSDGAYVWSGRATGTHTGTVIMVVRDGQVTGEIRTTAGLYEIRPDGGGQKLIEIDPAGYPEPARGETDGIDYPDPDSLPVPPEVGGDSGDRFDLLVVYTAAARNGAGGEAAMLSQIDLAVAQTNQAMDAAGATSDIRLVHAAEVPYTEGGDMQADLYDLNDPNDGVLDEAMVLRETYGADMVHLIVNSGQYCGIAFILGPTAVTRRSCATGNLTFAHEQGHNMGARHDWYVDDSGTYNHGFVSNPGGFRTVMAYSSGCTGFCQRVVTFSSPNSFVNGYAAGVASGTDLSCAEGVANPPCDADNGLAFNNNANIVANWRQEVSGATCQGQPVTVDIGAGDSPTSGDDVILGTPGDDTINGGDGDDIICGEGGADVIGGNAGNDSIVGGDGNDTIFGGSGDDALEGQSGADTVGGGSGVDIVRGGSGADNVLGGGDADTEISGGSGNDNVSGGGGNDRDVHGDNGNDVIGGGPGNDRIWGDAGDDTIYSGKGNDVSYGGPGNDSVYGARGNDRVYGDDGDDALFGGNGTDVCDSGTETTAGGDTTDGSCETVLP